MSEGRCRVVVPHDQGQVVTADDDGGVGEGDDGFEVLADEVCAE